MDTSVQALLRIVCVKEVISLLRQYSVKCGNWFLNEERKEHKAQ